MNITNSYYNYSNVLFGGKVNTSNSLNMQDLLLNNYSAGKLSYGKNNANALSSATKNFLVETKTGSELLKKSLYDLTGNGKNKSVFNKLTAVSSSSEHLSISSVADQAKLNDNTEVEIMQVATTQKNEGTKLLAATKNYSSSNYQLEIETEGKKHQISFRTASGDTNQDIQRKMAEAINGKNIGVKASVSYNDKEKTSVLSIESIKTGSETNGNPKFTVKDIYGDAVAKMGVSSITQEAKDAIYRVNSSETKTSKSNHVDLGNGISATLKKASQENITVSLGTDKLASQNKVREMVNAYNDLLATADNNKEDSGAKRLFNELRNNSKTYSNSLNRVGITISADGYMAIDAEKMQKAADSGDLAKLFTGDGMGTSYGFANRLTRTTEKANADPTQYVSATAMNEPLYNYKNNQTVDYLLNYRYNSIANMGLLFDSFM